MTTDADRRLRIALHEASHAAVGYAIGWRVRLVVVHRGARLSGFAEHHPRTDLSALELAVDDITILCAGEIGELLVPYSGYIESVDDCETAIAIRAKNALAEIAPGDALFTSYVLSDDRDRQGDEAKTLEIARQVADDAASMEATFLVAFCRERARRLVWSHVPAIQALAEELLRRPILDGVTVETILRGATPAETAALAGGSPASIQQPHEGGN